MISFSRFDFVVIMNIIYPRFKILWKYFTFRLEVGLEKYLYNTELSVFSLLCVSEIFFVYSYLLPSIILLVLNIFLARYKYDGHSCLPLVASVELQF